MQNPVRAQHVTRQLIAYYSPTIEHYMDMVMYVAAAVLDHPDSEYYRNRILNWMLRVVNYEQAELRLYPIMTALGLFRDDPNYRDMVSGIEQEINRRLYKRFGRAPKTLKPYRLLDVPVFLRQLEESQTLEDFLRFVASQRAIGRARLSLCEHPTS